MSLRQMTACHIAPLFLRLALGATFLWAGLGKLLEDSITLGPDNAPALLEVGAIDRATADPLLPPGYTPPVRQASPAPDRTPKEGTKDDDEGFFGPGGGAMAEPAGAAIVLASQSTPDTRSLKGLYGVGLLVYHAARPGVDAEGRATRPIIPEGMGRGSWPRYLAWGATFTEIFAGGFMLLGFLTRISGLALAGVMATAMWLTQLGPAMQSGATRLGFLPNHDLFDSAAWSTFGWQLALLCAAMAMVFAGPGGASLDRLLFGGGKGAVDADED